MEQGAQPGSWLCAERYAPRVCYGKKVCEVSHGDNGGQGHPFLSTFLRQVVVSSHHLKFILQVGVEFLEKKQSAENVAECSACLDTLLRVTKANAFEERSGSTYHVVFHIEDGKRGSQPRLLCLKFLPPIRKIYSTAGNLAGLTFMLKPRRTTLAVLKEELMSNHLPRVLSTQRPLVLEG